MTNNCSKCSLDTLLSASPYRRNPKYLSSAHLAKQEATKVNLTSDQKGLSSVEKSTLKRLNGLEICVEADWEEATHIGEIVGVFCFVLFSGTHDKILLAKFWVHRGLCLASFFSAILASLLAKGSASIQLICQSAWLGLLLLLLLAVARVICKIHCSTISVVCCVVFRLAVFLFTSSWREDSANQVTDKLNWLSLLLLFDVIFFAAV